MTDNKNLNSTFPIRHHQTINRSRSGKLHNQVPEQPSQTFNVHEHHRFESLLKYVTSYVFDLKMLMADLKDIACRIVGVQISKKTDKNSDQSAKGSSSHKNSSKSQSVRQDCQIEFMMANCRNVKADLVKVLCLLRGYQSGFNLSRNRSLCEICNQKITCKQKDIENLPQNKSTMNQQTEPLFQSKKDKDTLQQISNNMKIQSSEKFELKFENLSNQSPNVLESVSKQSGLSIDEIGYLTFREKQEHKQFQESDTLVKQHKSLSPHQLCQKERDKREYLSQNVTENDLKHSFPSLSDQQINNLWLSSLKLIEMSRRIVLKL